ncbi:unnamed protein product [Arctogadus glacialis]
MLRGTAPEQAGCENKFGRRQKGELKESRPTTLDCCEGQTENTNVERKKKSITLDEGAEWLTEWTQQPRSHTGGTPAGLLHDTTDATGPSLIRLTILSSFPMLTLKPGSRRCKTYRGLRSYQGSALCGWDSSAFHRGSPRSRGFDWVIPETQRWPCGFPGLGSSPALRRLSSLLALLIPWAPSLFTPIPSTLALLLLVPSTTSGFPPLSLTQRRPPLVLIGLDR